MKEKKEEKKEPTLYRAQETDFNLIPISPNGDILRDKDTGAIFTVEVNGFTGERYLKQHTKGR